MQTGTDRYSEGAAIAQWVERPTEKPGAVLTRVRVPGAARDFFFSIFFSHFFSFPESTFSADSLTVSVQPPVCNRMHQHLCAR